MKRVIIVYTAVLACIALFFVLIFAKRAGQNEPTPQQQIEQTEQEITYTIKEYKGKIAVFERDSDVPFKVTDVFISQFSEIDQDLLKKGINAKNQAEIKTILEDYCS